MNISYIYIHYIITNYVYVYIYMYSNHDMKYQTVAACGHILGVFFGRWILKNQILSIRTEGPE